MQPGVLVCMSYNGLHDLNQKNTYSISPWLWIHVTISLHAVPLKVIEWYTLTSIICVIGWPCAHATDMHGQYTVLHIREFLWTTLSQTACALVLAKISTQYFSPQLKPHRVYTLDATTITSPWSYSEPMHGYFRYDLMKLRKMAWLLVQPWCCTPGTE